MFDGSGMCLPAEENHSQHIPVELELNTNWNTLK
jgi:hypothetical protein